MKKPKKVPKWKGGGHPGLNPASSLEKGGRRRPPRATIMKYIFAFIGGGLLALVSACHSLSSHDVPGQSSTAPIVTEAWTSRNVGIAGVVTLRHNPSAACFLIVARGDSAISVIETGPSVCNDER